jgi:hypothetical protein
MPTSTLSPVQQAAVELHVEAILKEEFDNLKINVKKEDIIPLIQDYLDDLIAKAITPTAPIVKKAILAAVSPEVIGESSVQKFLKKYVSPGRALKPVLLIGDTGSGKTTAGKQFAYWQPFEEVVIFNGDEGVDAQQMKGGPRPWPSGGGTTTVWQDGELARAFRMAQQGKRTILYIDELYRIKVRERSKMITEL